MKIFNFLTRLCVMSLCIVGILSLASDSFAKRRKGRSLNKNIYKQIKEINTVGFSEKAEVMRKHKDKLVQLMVKADIKERINNATIDEENARIRSQEISLNADFTSNLEVLNAQKEHKDAYTFKSGKEIEELSKQIEIDHTQKLTSTELDHQKGLQSIQREKAKLHKQTQEDISAIRSMKNELNHYIASSQAEIDQLKNEINLSQEKEQAIIRDLSARALGIEEKAVAEVSKVNEQMEAYKKEQYARSSQLRQESDALEKKYLAEVSHLRAQAASQEAKAKENSKKRLMKIKKTRDKFHAEISKIRSDTEVEQKMLNADIEMWTSDIKYYKESKEAELETLKATFEDEIQNRKNIAQLLKDRADTLEKEIKAVENYMRVKESGNQTKYDMDKEVEIIKTLSSARDVILDGKGVELYLDKQSHEQNKKPEHSENKQGWNEYENMRPSQVHDDIKKDRDKIRSFNKRFSIKLERIKADRKEMNALIETEEKRIDAELNRMYAVAKAERIARQSTIDLNRSKADNLEKQHRAELDKMQVEEQANYKKEMAEVDIFLAEAEKVSKRDKAAVSEVRAMADSIERYLPIEVKSQVEKANTLMVQARAESALLKAQAGSRQAILDGVNKVKEAQISAMVKTLGVIRETMGTELSAKTAIAQANEKLELSKISMNQALLKAQYAKTRADLENMKSEQQAYIQEKQAMKNIQERIYEVEIEQKTSEIHAKKSIAESNLAIDEAGLASLQKTSIAEIQAMRVKALSEKQKVMALEETSKVEARARQERSVAILDQAEAIAQSITKAAEDTRKALTDQLATDDLQKLHIGNLKIDKVESTPEPKEEAFDEYTIMKASEFYTKNSLNETGALA